MEYVIFISIALTVMTFYHAYKSHKSGYQKFEYYLNGETNWFVRNLVTIWTFVLFFVAIGVIVYLGGKFIKIFI